MKNLKQLFEDVGGVKSSGVPAEDPTGSLDGQPRRNFYVPSAMTSRDVIANILEKFTKSGVTYSFQGDDLIITAGTYSAQQQQQNVQDSLKETIVEVTKFLKDEYKSATGKALALGKIEHEAFDCVANYTTNRLSLCRLTCTYELPASTAADDVSSEKAEIKTNILPAPKQVK